MPQAVRVVGTAHGALFVLMFAALAEVSIRRRRWSGELWGKAFIASLIPFGTFVFDRRLKQMEADDSQAAAVDAVS